MLKAHPLRSRAGIAHWLAVILLGLLGLGSAQAVPLANVAKVVTGGNHTCALTSVGGVKCWGYNGYGELGDNSTTNRLTPVDVTGLARGVIAIAAGEIHTCALTTVGGVKCWGRNTYGQLGDNSTTSRLTPVDVTGLASGVTAISAGHDHTCALTTAGGVKCWGRNTYGQLGDNSATTRLTPVDVTGLASGVMTIAAGIYHTCALTTAGGVKCWGENGVGQLGDNSTTTRLTPVDVTGLASGVTAIAAGTGHTCALTTAGGAKCWGHNGYGELGDNSTTSSLTPVDVAGLASGVTAISTGGYHTCALTTAGGTKCWGYNQYGQLGDNSTTTRLTPVDVTGLASGMTAIAAGYSHTCALTTAGGVKCWGYNNNGELGDNTTTRRLAPVDVNGVVITAPSAGLLAYYRFNGDVLDSSGNARDATLVGGSSFVAGAEGSALNIDNMSRYVSVNGINVGSAFSYSGWYRLSSTAALTAPTPWQTFFHSSSNYCGSGASLGVMYERVQKFLRIYDGSNCYGIQSIPHIIANDTWFHIAITYDGTRIKTYIDGILKGDLAWASWITNVSPLKIGAAIQPAGWSAYNWQGAIDEVRIYNRPLTAAEVAGLAGAPASGWSVTAATPTTARVDVLQQFTVSGSGFTGSTQLVLDNCENDASYVPSPANTATQVSFRCTPRLPGPAALKIDGTPAASVFVDNPTRLGDPAAHGIPSLKGVSLWNGNFHHEVADMDVPGKGLSFVLSRSYNTYYWQHEHERGGVDNYHPWRFNWDLSVGYVNGNTSQLYVKREDGRGETFYKDTDGVWYPIDQGNFDTLQGDTPVAGQTTLTTRDGRLYVFQNPDLGGKLLQVKDHDGHALTLAYDGNGKLTTVTDTVGRDYAFSYHPSGLLYRVTDFTNRYVEYTWESDTAPNTGDARDRIKTVRDVRGNVTTYHYTAHPSIDPNIGPRIFLTSIVDPRHNSALTLTYSDAVYGNWGVASLTDAANSTWNFTFCAEKDQAGACDTTDKAISFRTNVTAPIAASSFKAHFDTAGRYAGKTDARNHRNVVTPHPTAGLTVRTYNFAGLTDARQTAKGFQTSYQHHTSGNTSATSHADGGKREVKTWAEDPVRNLYLPTETWSAACADASQTCIKRYTGYDASGKVLSTRVGDLPAATNSYVAGLLSQSTDPLGHATGYAYDGQGNLTQSTDALGQVTHYAYDNLGRVTRKTDPRGVITDTTYDAAGNVKTETVDPGTGHLNLLTRYDYDANGNQIQHIDPNGNVTTTTYDAANRVAAVTRTVSGVPVTTSTGYDALGRAVSTSNANGHAQTTAYDDAGNVASRSDALPRTTRYTYDEDNRLLTQTDPEGRVTSYDYDSMGRVTRVTTPDGFVQSAYDKDGRLLSQTDKNNQITTYGYDGAGRKISVTDPNNTVTLMTYYNDGKLHTVADPRGNVSTYEYDALGRRTRITDPKNRVWQTAYDPSGNVVLTIDPAGNSATHGYDAANRLTGISWSDGTSVNYVLDSNGNHRQVTDNTGTTFYTYDEADRIKTATDPNSQTVSYAYDGVGNVTTLGYPGSHHVSYQYDVVERMWRMTDWGARSTTWTLDRSDRVTHIAHGNGVATSMGHDPAGRLNSLVVTKPDNSVLASWALTRDNNGNITQANTLLPLQPTLVAGASSQSYDTDNRQNGLSYDAAGRITHNGTYALTWNARDQVTSINGDAQTYNTEGTRVAQTAGGVTTRFVMDSNSNLPNLLAETNAGNVVQRYYLHSPYGLVEQIDATGTPRFYHYDSNGNTVALTDAAGQVTDAYAYTPFGETTVSGATANPFRFVGQYGVRNFNGTPLHDMRARWYAADQARFLSLDPLLGETDRPQSLNRYAYVEGNPVNGVDPSGLVAIRASTRAEISNEQWVNSDAVSVLENFGNELPPHVRNALNQSNGSRIYSGTYDGLAFSTNGCGKEGLSFNWATSAELACDIHDMNYSLHMDKVKADGLLERIGDFLQLRHAGKAMAETKDGYFRSIRMYFRGVAYFYGSGNGMGKVVSLNPAYQTSIAYWEAGSEFLDENPGYKVENEFKYMYTQ
jgi:RHS repeat-associated protein